MNLKTGVRYSQVCDDGGVYYLNFLNYMWHSPSISGPAGFGALTEYGSMPYWPTSASATVCTVSLILSFETPRLEANDVPWKAFDSRIPKSYPTTRTCSRRSDAESAVFVQAYRILNPNPNASPPNITASDPSIYGQATSEFAYENSTGLLGLVLSGLHAWSRLEMVFWGLGYLNTRAMRPSSTHVAPQHQKNSYIYSI